MENLLKKEKGLTLPEILASIVILGIVITTFIGFFSQAFLHNSMTSDKMQAYNLAREKQARFKDQTTPIYKDTINQFIMNVSDGTISSLDLSMTNSQYSALNLSEDILQVTLPEQVGSSTVNDPYFLMKLNESPYVVHVYLKKSPDLTTSKGLSLFRMYVQVFENSKMLSDTYAYIEYQ